MKEQIERDVFDRPIRVLIPENEADMRRLREMDESGDLDTDHSFADRPESLPLEETPDDEE